MHGFSSSSGSDNYRYFMHFLQSLHVDVAGLAETNTCWQHPHLRDNFNNVVRRFHWQSKTVFGSPSNEVDPILLSETFQTGRTIPMAVDNLVSRVRCHSLSDPTGLGCWCDVTFSGWSDTQKLTVVAAYRVCSDSILAFFFKIFNNEFFNSKKVDTLLSSWMPMLLCNLTTILPIFLITVHALTSTLMILLSQRTLGQSPAGLIYSSTILTLIHPSSSPSLG